MCLLFIWCWSGWMMTSNAQVCIFACGLTSEERVDLYWVQSKAEIGFHWGVAMQSAENKQESGVVTDVVMKRFFFTDIISWYPLKVTRYFRGIFNHLQGWRTNRVRNLQPATCSELVSCSTYVVLMMEVICPPEISIDFQQTIVHGIISQKTKVDIVWG